MNAINAAIKHKTGIEWTHLPGHIGATWNPTTGCSKVSPGCAHCYAESFTLRFHRGGPFVPEKQDSGDIAYPEVTSHPERLMQPISWRQPHCIFVGSMSDIFHPDVPFEFVDWLIGIVILTQFLSHKYIFLTKRPERMAEYFARDHFIERVRWNISHARDSDPTLQARIISNLSILDNSTNIKNLAVGTSVENQHFLTERMEYLKTISIPAIRFLSCEPLLGPLDLKPYFNESNPCRQCRGSGSVAPWMGDGVYRDGGRICPDCMGCRVQETCLDWVIVGGESGSGARLTHPDWIREIRDACEPAGVPFFFKQWGVYRPMSLGELFDWKFVRRRQIVHADPKDRFSIEPKDNDEVMIRTSKKEAGALLDGKVHEDWPNAWL